ncbi:MAG TPA: RNA-binding domain-containing protein [Thermoanaerobaculia bacterium]|nr:RNA-binding domain-containing protein [Thermoanaerobaculia bacterium]
MDFSTLNQLAAAGESETLEFKTTTGQLPQAGKTLCGFLNKRGGTVVFGIDPQGRPLGQLVTDSTLREIGEILRRLEPAAPITLHRVGVPDSQHELLALEAEPRPDLLPFTFDGRPWERLGTTVAPMSQVRYQELLLARTHSRHRWETMPAEGISLRDLDEKEILRTARTGVASGRLPEYTGYTAVELLDRFGLRAEGKLLNASPCALWPAPTARFPSMPGAYGTFQRSGKNRVSRPTAAPRPCLLAAGRGPPISPPPSTGCWSDPAGSFRTSRRATLSRRSSTGSPRERLLSP